jgi:hypothetical protein
MALGANQPLAFTPLAGAGTCGFATAAKRLGSFSVRIVLLLIPDFMHAEVKRATGRESLFNIKQTWFRNTK